jgi:hypothetical protein
MGRIVRLIWKLVEGLWLQSITLESHFFCEELSSSENQATAANSGTGTANGFASSGQGGALGTLNGVTINAANSTVKLNQALDL